MQYRFIWNIDQDQIHFVNNFDFEEPLEDNYITGDYLPADKSISLYKEDVKVPINLDYFVRLWKASEPDKEIVRERVEVVSLNKVSNVRLASSQEEKLVAQFLIAEHGQDSMLNLDKLFEANPTPDDVRRYFIPFIKKFNQNTFKQFPDNLPRNAKQWRALSEEEVFAYVEYFANNISRGDQQLANSLTQAMMDKWEMDGVPFDPAEYIIDEGMINWNEVRSLLLREFGNSFNLFSKWEKVSDYGGWTNWETFLTNNIMENEFNIYKYFLDLAKKAISKYPSETFFELKEVWREKIEEMVIDVHNRTCDETERIDDILKVDFDEILGHWFEKVNEELGYDEVYSLQRKNQILDKWEPESWWKGSKWNKISDHNGWTNWETWNVNLMMENDYDDYLYFTDLAKKNISVDDFAMAAIERVIGPYNEQLRNDFAEYTDEEEILMQLENDDQKWRSDAERRYPDDPEAQEDYIRKMREIVYGLMGIPEPTDIANHWLDESKVNWQEIYENWVNNTKESNWKVLKWNRI